MAFVMKAVVLLAWKKGSLNFNAIILINENESGKWIKGKSSIIWYGCRYKDGNCPNIKKNADKSILELAERN